jgi:WD40 repeat protein
MPSKPHDESKQQENGRAVPTETRSARAQRFFFGDDIFISYSRHNSDYALALGDRLTKQKLSCFVDQWGTPSNEDLPPELVERLRKSTTLVILGTVEAARSDNVRKEVVEFKKTKRPIIPITFVEQEEFARIRSNEIPDGLKGTLERSDWYGEITGIALTFESKAKLRVDDPKKSVEPSAEVITRVVNAVNFLSRSRRLRRTFWATLSLLLLLILSTATVTYALIKNAQQEVQKAGDLQRLAETKAAEAETSRQAADAARTDAEQKRADAEEATKKAQSDQRAAEGKLKKANDDLVDADRKTREAQTKAETARTQQLEAERLKREAVIQRVAASAQEAAVRHPTLGVLLAERAESAADSADQRIFSAESALRGALAGIGGKAVAPLDDPNLKESNLIFSPNGRWLLAEKYGFAAVCDGTADRPKWKALSPPQQAAQSEPTYDGCKDLAFSPDGDRVARACNDVVYVWDLRAEQDALSPVPLPPEVNSENVLNSAEARWLVKARVLPEPDPRSLLACMGGASSLPAAAEQEAYIFSDDWRWLAYTDGASEFRLYDLKGRSPATPVKVISAAYKNVRIEGRWLLLTAADDSQKYLDLQTFGPESEPFTLPDMAARDTMSDEAVEKETFLYSPDGRWLAHFDGVKKVRMYDLTAKPGPKLFPLSEVEDKGTFSPIPQEWHKTTYMTFSPGGRWFRLRTAEGVTLWEMGDAGPTSPQAGAAVDSSGEDFTSFSDDDRWLLTLRGNGDIQLRRLKAESERTDDPSEQNLFDLRVAPGRYFPVPRFSPGSRWLFLDVGDVINAWSLRHPEQRPLELRGREHKGLVVSSDNLVFSADGRYAAAMGADGVARIWGLENLQPTAQPQTFRVDDDFSTHILSPDNRWLLTRAKNHPSLLWDMNDERAWAHPVTLTDGVDSSYGPSDIGRLPFSPDGRWLITRSQSGDAQVWDLMTIKTQPRPFEIKLTGFMIAFSPDSRRLVATCADGVTRVWNLPLDDSHKPAVELPRRASPDLVVLFGKTSRFLVAINKEDCRLFDLTAAATGWPETGVQLVTYGTQAATSAFPDLWSPHDKPVFSPDDRWLAMQDGRDVHLWDLRASPPNRPALSYRDQFRDATPYIALNFSPKGDWLLTDTLREANLWRLTDAPTITNVTPRGEWSVETFSPDGRWLIVNKENKTTELWDLTETPRVIRLPGWEGVLPPNESAFSPDAHWLMITKKSDSKTAEKDLLIWDLRDPSHARRVIPEATLGSMKFSPDGRWFLTNKSVRGRQAETSFWDLRLKNPFEKAAFESNGVETFSPDGRWMASRQGVGVALWDLSQLPSQTDPFILPSSQLDEYGGTSEGQGSRLAFDARHLYLFGREVLRWDLDSERLRAQALEAAGRPLTADERLRYLEDFDTNEHTAAHGSGNKPPDR